MGKGAENQDWFPIERVRSEGDFVCRVRFFIRPSPAVGRHETMSPFLPGKVENTPGELSIEQLLVEILVSLIERLELLFRGCWWQHDFCFFLSHTARF